LHHILGGGSVRPEARELRGFTADGQEVRITIGDAAGGLSCAIRPSFGGSLVNCYRV